MSPIAGRARFGGCAFGTNADLLQRIDMRQRTTTGTDFHHVDHRDRDRHARAFLEAIRTCHFKNTACFGGLVLDQADFGGRTAHVEGQHFVQTIARRNVCRKNCAACRAGFDQAHRKIGCVLD